MLYYVLLCCCSAAVLLLYRVVGGYIGSFLSCVHTGSWVCLFPFLPLYRPRAGIVKRAASDITPEY